MTDDELAAVVAAARQLFVRSIEREFPPVGVRWRVAGRLAKRAADNARFIAGARSRWTILGRLHG